MQLQRQVLSSGKWYSYRQVVLNAHARAKCSSTLRMTLKGISGCCLDMNNTFFDRCTLSLLRGRSQAPLTNDRGYFTFVYDTGFKLDDFRMRQASDFYNLFFIWKTNFLLSTKFDLKTNERKRKHAWFISNLYFQNYKKTETCVCHIK